MREELNGITQRVIGAAIAVHRQLGPGLLESTYEACLEHELIGQGLSVERQKVLPVVYKDVRLDCGYRIDLLVEGKVILELKAVDDLLPIHEAQVLSYLKLSGCRVGLLINFNVRLLTRGVKRIINGSLD
ncbi:MAG: GxxExxY protein [Planctomycetaceae bacterium]|nr:GxxExxY protein [Planctomycetaceae bacterium]